MAQNQNFQFLITQFNISRDQVDRFWCSNQNIFLPNYGEAIRVIMFEQFEMRVHIYKGNGGKRLISIYVHCLNKNCKRPYKLKIHRADIRFLDNVEVTVYGNDEEICQCGIFA